MCCRSVKALLNRLQVALFHMHSRSLDFESIHVASPNFVPLPRCSGQYCDADPGPRSMEEPAVTVAGGSRLAERRKTRRVALTRPAGDSSLQQHSVFTRLKVAKMASGMPKMGG